MFSISLTTRTAVLMYLQLKKGLLMMKTKFNIKSKNSQNVRAVNSSAKVLPQLKCCCNSNTQTLAIINKCVIIAC